MAKCLFTAFLGLMLGLTLHAQELEVTVKVNTPTIQMADPRVFQDLQAAIQGFMNNQKWTNETYQPEERIKVTLLLNITQEFSASSFGGDLNIQAVRPVYGSTYETPLISHLDKDVTFTYEQFQPLEFSENNFNDNISSILSFYAYVILGLDYDSFSPLGGEPYFQIAQDVLNAVPQAVTANNKGWRSIDGNRNRYWIVENLLSPRVRNLRQAYYDYHRQALDLMSSDVVSGRALMLEAIEAVAQVNQTYPNAMAVQMFTNAKSNEIVEIYKQGTPTEKNRIVQSMTRIDGSNASKYRAIRE
ncbi:MAG: DUF4835 family protein [Saprospirales bacterium]|jgi:hypothetical protein|nr:DUF4835 family protein [Saprospirales bacterium]MBK6903567.1 DUF4835 family protein [Saprospirales bacterium]MBK7338648.1 DUF4835 family protein [Saprospirales bacterium]